MCIIILMKRKDHYLTEPQIEKLEKYSEELGIKVSELIRRIIDEFFLSKEKELNENTYKK